MRVADRLGAFLLLALALGACAAEPGGKTAEAAAPDTFPPLTAPLDPPLVVTSTFGEFRTGHFHAGLDFSTGQESGRPVYAPLDGWVARVRASGSGYGRSLTLEAEDGRMILFGHLDAFAGPVADLVAARQDSTGDYELDLSPERGRFPVRAGDLVAWSGASGVGPPHLHMEVRRGDLAFNPQRFGLPVADTLAPSVGRITLEPVGPGSLVRRMATPRVVGLGAHDTVVVEGRARVWAQVVDPGVHGARMAPLETWLEWEGRRLTCRFDRVAWDEDMTAVEWVYDGTGRVSAGRPIGLRVAGLHPIVIDTTGWDGTITLAPGDTARTLTVGTRDAVGHEATRRVVLRGPRPAEAGADSTRKRVAAAAAIPATAIALAPGRTAESGAALAPFAWRLGAEGVFDTATVRVARRPVPVAAGFAVVDGAWAVEPAALPLRRAAIVSVPLPSGVDRAAVGLYVDAGRGWRLVAAADSAGAFTGATRTLGRFALLRDVSPPRLLPRRTLVRRGVSDAYSRWVLQAGVIERGSGVDPRDSGFTVDGVRVPTEFDPDEAQLRWRPRARPAPGTHRYTVVVTDRAGLATRASGTFVVR